MRLPQEDVNHFYKLNPPLLFHVNAKRNLKPCISSIDQLMALPIAERVAIRNALYDDPSLFDTFIAENPFKLQPEGLEIIKSRQIEALFEKRRQPQPLLARNRQSQKRQSAP